MKLIFTILVLIITLISCSNDLGKEKIAKYLTENYELESNRLKNFEKKYYIKKGTLPFIEKIDTEFLESKTKYSFYRTVLNNTLSVVPRSRVIMALPNSEEEKIFEIKSIYELDTYSEFMTVFEGIKFLEISQKESLVKEVSKLAESYIINGEIRNMQELKNEFKIEIWTTEKISKILTFNFNEYELLEITIKDSNE